jgi:hypothetical protein
MYKKTTHTHTHTRYHYYYYSASVEGHTWWRQTLKLQKKGKKNGGAGFRQVLEMGPGGRGGLLQGFRGGAKVDGKGLKQNV